LAEEHRHPVLLELFRRRLVAPRRAMLRAALERGVEDGELAPSFDVDAVSNMLIGAFYARYISGRPIPKDWPRRVLAVVWRAAGVTSERRAQPTEVSGASYRAVASDGDVAVATGTTRYRPTARVLRHWPGVS
jgi:hypothetical protein